MLCLLSGAAASNYLCRDAASVCQAPCSLRLPLLPEPLSQAPKPQAAKGTVKQHNMDEAGALFICMGVSGEADASTHTHPPPPPPPNWIICSGQMLRFVSANPRETCRNTSFHSLRSILWPCFDPLIAPSSLARRLWVGVRWGGGC